MVTTTHLHRDSANGRLGPTIGAGRTGVPRAHSEQSPNAGHKPWDVRRRRLLRTVGLIIVASVVAALAIVDRDPRAARGTGIHCATSQGLLASGGGKAIDPALFATGSCMANPPPSGNRDESVLLDPGHGVIGPGGVGVTQAGQMIYESNETLPVELAAMTLPAIRDPGQGNARHPRFCHLWVGGVEGRSRCR
jgi:N-acetylmuramoyl-L-alanine amidase